MSDEKSVKPDEPTIRERAHALWRAEGEPHGRHEEFWHRAREELVAEARSGSLDDQLADSFPASDPPSITEPGREVGRLPAAPEDEAAPAKSATLEELPSEPNGAKPSPPTRPKKRKAT